MVNEKGLSKIKEMPLKELRVRFPPGCPFTPSLTVGLVALDSARCARVQREALL